MKIVFIILLSLICNSALSQVKVGLPMYGGTACPAGSASVQTIDHLLEILFDQFPGQQNGRLTIQKCTVRVPVKVTGAYQISFEITDATGFVHLEPAGKAQLEFKSYFTSQFESIQRNMKNFIGPTSQEFELATDILLTERVWSRCGTSDLVFGIDITAKIAAVKPPISDQYLSLGSLRYKINWRRC